MRTATVQAKEHAWDVALVRKDFPALDQSVHGKPLVYLDNAATTQKPRAVLDAMQQYYERDNSNVHRGVHALSQRATEAFESARGKLRRFLNAAEDREIIFTRGATEAINLVANSYGRSTLKPGDEILISHMEHHSNIVPWQMLCEQTGAALKIIPINDAGEIQLDEYATLLNDRTKIVSVVHVSNALGTVNPIGKMAAMAHDAGAVMVVDGAQAAPHTKIDVRSLGVDFYAVSAHKMYGPTGIGALYGRRDLLEAMPPWQGGGDMIKSVTFDKTLYNDVPFRFEAGTPNIAGAIGFGAAADYITSLGMDRIAAYERELLAYAVEAVRDIPGLNLIGTAAHKASIVAFTLADIHPHDIGTIVDHEGVAIRTGHHCTQPLMERFGVPATARASLAFYNTREEIDALARSLQRVLEVFG
jgi:cysteine desulfurase / selenocysteine lyase